MDIGEFSNIHANDSSQKVNTYKIYATLCNLIPDKVHATYTLKSEKQLRYRCNTIENMKKYCSRL